MALIAVVVGLGAMNIKPARGQASPVLAQVATPAPQPPAVAEQKPPQPQTAGLPRQAGRDRQLQPTPDDSIKEQLDRLRSALMTLQARREEANADPSLSDRAQKVEAQIQAVQSQLAAYEERTRDQLNQARVQEQLARVQKQVGVLESAMAYESDPETRKQVLQSLAVLVNQRNRLRSQASGDPAPEVASILIRGLTPAAEQDLRARLPVHIGSPLSGSALHDGYDFVSAFDRNLEFSVVMLPDRKAEVRISAHTP